MDTVGIPDFTVGTLGIWPPMKVLSVYSSLNVSCEMAVPLIDEETLLGIVPGQLVYSSSLLLW